MKYWQFVNWEPAPIESALKSRVVKIGGWAFSLREFCRVYWVKSRYYGIMELYAPNKSAIYAVLGRYHVLKIVEV